MLDKLKIYQERLIFFVK